MRLLLVTPKLDPADDLFGHVNAWATALAQRVERLYVVALWPGRPVLPPNARFATLGKAPDEGGAGSLGSRARWLLRLQRIVARLCLRDEIDAVLAHMGPVFAAAAAPVTRATGRPTFLWYAHGQVSPLLRLAHALVDGVGTSTPEGFRIPSDKVTITGQGIDLARFHPGCDAPTEPARHWPTTSVESTQHRGSSPSPACGRGGQGVRGVPGQGVGGAPPQPVRLLSVGRFSPVKDYETLLDALAHPALKPWPGLAADLVGGVHSAPEAAYLESLRQRARQHGLSERVRFVAGLPHAEIVPTYQQADLFATCNRTGSLDKAVLEAAACGLPTVVCSPAFRALFGEQWADLSFAPGDATGLARRLAGWLERTPAERRTAALKIRAEVARAHSVDHWADAVVAMIARGLAGR